MKVDDEGTAAAKKSTTAKVMGFAHCVLLVLSIDLGGLASSLWQAFLLCGLKEAMIMFFTMSMGSFVLLLCLSELVGIVPFAGGNFGFVRCSLGPFWGFMAASLEFLYYNLFNARVLLKIAMLVEAAHEFNPDWQYLWAFLGMVLLLLVNIRGGMTFWGIMMTSALFTMSILMIFYVGAYSNIDLNGYGYGRHYAPKYHNEGYIGDGTRYMTYEFRVAVFYLGLEILPLCSLRVKDESKVIPRALMTSFAVIFTIAILASIGVALSAPGIHPALGRASFVLQFGLSNAITMDPKRYPLLLLPPTIASGIGYLYAAGNQLAAMAESGLMPKGLRPRYGADQVPIPAMVTCALIQFFVYAMLHHFEPTLVTFSSNIWSLAAPALFTLICAAFIAFRRKFGSMKRNFVSPLGIPGAVFGCLLWMHIFVVNSDHRFQPNTKATKAFYIFMSIMIVYYFGFVQFVQFFSQEEQEKFMKAYVLNANQMRKKRGGYYGYMANMWRRTAAVTSFLRFGTSHHTSGHSSSTAPPGAKTTASGPPAASMALTMGGGLHSNKVEPFKPNSVKMNHMTTREAARTQRKASLRASLTNGSLKMGWSGKTLTNEHDSRRVFALLNHDPLAVEDNDAAAAGAAAATAGGDHSEAHTAVGDEDELATPVGPSVALMEEFPEHFVPILATVADEDVALSESADAVAAAAAAAAVVLGMGMVSSTGDVEMGDQDSTRVDVGDQLREVEMV